jgi:murein DD-endopeptidase MepM/ murein hydrolase activator NlpD
MRAALAALTTISLAGPALAGDFSLALPVDCTLGVDCYIQQYVDRDPGPGAVDHSCGPLSYDTHNGTDFALPTLRDLDRAVAVLAAAGGTVRAVRDGMADRLYRDGDDLGGKECGNGVVIDHEDGWQSQYCHLENGSIAVAPGARVAQGDALGRIGLSGQTQFAHLHFTLRQRGEVVDPFGPGATCGQAGAALWQDPIPYAPGGLLDIGFSPRIPDFRQIQAGDAADPGMNARSPALVLFAFAYGGRAGDVMHLRIDGPDGEVVNETLDLDRTQAQLFRASGRPRPPAGWPAGTYTGQATLIRDGVAIDALSAEILIR